MPSDEDPECVTHPSRIAHRSSFIVSMRTLITGISGFAGRHLADVLSREGDEVFGTHREPASRAGLQRWLGPGRCSDASLYVVDLLDVEGLTNVVATVRPQRIFHLAGTAQVGASHASPAAVFAANAVGTLNLLAAVRDGARDCRVVTVGSGDSYGDSQRPDEPITEDSPLQPLSAYGVSKASADLIAYQWAHGYGLDVVRVRPFNHIGPGQRLGFVCSDFAQQLVAIERGRQRPSVVVGNLDAIRDFTDVRDTVAGYVAASNRGATGEAYNVCSGIGRSVRTLLDDLIALSGVHVEVEVAPDRLRTIDVPKAVGSADKLRSLTGWRPRYAWTRTLADVLEDWRRRE